VLLNNLASLGEAANTTHLHLIASSSSLPNARASVAVNSLGLLDLLQITGSGLSARAQYQVYLAESSRAPYGRLEALAILKTNPDGAGSAQAIGPLKTLGANDLTSRYQKICNCDRDEGCFARRAAARAVSVAGRQFGNNFETKNDKSNSNLMR